MTARSIAEVRTEFRVGAGFSPMQRLGRRLMLGALGDLNRGVLTVEEPAGSHRFGAESEDGLRASVRIRDPRAWSAMVFGGSVGAGEAFVEGWWESDDPTRVMQILLRNRAVLERVDRRFRMIIAPLKRIACRMERNTRAGSRRNIAAHYDLSNEFFALWLDPTMTYSCAIFERSDSTLEAAQREKLDRACRRLRLGASDHLLEIGTGWGSMAIHAAREYGCRVTTTTISAQQAELARARVRDAGLAERVSVVETDYRDLTGRFDKLVSIEMIEAVGAENLSAYYRRISELLRPGGSALIQAIVIDDRYFARAARTRDWLKAAIFPGSCLPSISAMQRAASDAGGLRLVHLEDIGRHYAATLRVWRDRFDRAEPEVRAMGFDEAFVRMWRYYLCYCEGAFHERHCSNVQVLYERLREGAA